MRAPRRASGPGPGRASERPSRMIQAPSTEAPDAKPTSWRIFAHALTRPYPVTVQMVALLAIVPAYVGIAELDVGRTLHVPEIALDRALPLLPAWALVYGTVYLFLILLPVFVIRREAHIRGLYLAYLTVWLAAYVGFLVYPTRAPRPALVAGDGFVAWGLRFLYSADPPYNCFPSLHVAHSFVSAVACYRVHQRVGMAALLGASLVALSTLFTKQHYAADVIAGMLLAFTASAIFLRTGPLDESWSFDRQVAPAVALWTGVSTAVFFACAWMAYETYELLRRIA